MPNIAIEVQLNEKQARAYLSWLNHQYQLAMSEFWYTDKYRHCPIGERAPKICQDHPFIAGLQRTARQLKAQLGETA